MLASNSVLNSHEFLKNYSMINRFSIILGKTITYHIYSKFSFEGNSIKIVALSRECFSHNEGGNFRV